MNIYVIRATHWDTPGEHVRVAVEREEADAQALQFVNDLRESGNGGNHPEISSFADGDGEPLELPHLDANADWREGLRETQRARISAAYGANYLTDKRRRPADDYSLAKAADFLVWIDELPWPAEYAHPVKLEVMEAYRYLADLTESWREQYPAGGRGVIAHVEKAIARVRDLDPRSDEDDPSDETRGISVTADMIPVEDIERTPDAIAIKPDADFGTFDLPPAESTNRISRDGTHISFPADMTMGELAALMGYLPPRITVDGVNVPIAHPDYQPGDIVSVGGISGASRDAGDTAVWQAFAFSRLAQAAREMLDAYGGDTPGWLRKEAVALAEALDIAVSQPRDWMDVRVTLSGPLKVDGEYRDEEWIARLVVCQPAAPLSN